MTASLLDPANRRRLYTYEITGRLLLALASYMLPEVFYADVQYYLLSGAKVGIDHLPYKDFVWEYPPLMTLVLGLVLVTAKQTIAFHLVFLVCTVLAEWGSMHLLRRYDSKNFAVITKYWTFTMLPLGLIAWNRFDYFSVILATLALIAFLQSRSAVKWIILGFLAKLWPVLIVVGLFARRRFKEVAYVIGGTALVTLAWYAFSPDGFRDFMKFRRGDGFQIESLPGSILHLTGEPYFFKYGTVSVSDAGYHWVQVLMFGLTIVGISALALLALRRKHDDVLLIGACVALALVSSRIISAQFLVWLAPFIVLRVTTHRRIAVEYAVAIALTIVFLFFYRQMSFAGAWAIETWLVVLRNVVLLVLTVEMIWATFSSSSQRRLGSST